MQRAIQRHKLIDPADTVVVGVSGGPDSRRLLHVLRQFAQDMSLRLHVAHLNHGLRGVEADADAAFVQETAAAWGLPAAVERVDVAAMAQQAGMSLEKVACHARYSFLAKVAGRVGARVIAVGHTADDQAETVLMHFLRGQWPGRACAACSRSRVLGFGRRRPSLTQALVPLSWCVPCCP